MKALIIGATGATGKDLVQVLLQDADYTQVVVFVRRSLGIAHPKLEEVLTDFDKLEQVYSQIKGDVVFSCLGTTLKTAGSKQKQWHIDHDIPFSFVAFAKQNGVPKAVLLSAYGASAASKVFYSHMKGKLEDAIEGLGFEQYIIFRPGLLLRKNTDRSAERTSAAILKFLNSLGIAKKFKPMPTYTLAEKMAKAAKTFPPGKHVVSLEKIFEV